MLSIANRYRGPYAESGIQLAEANHGNLQDYIDTHNKQIGLALRWKWVLQATKAVVLLHQKGVIHSDLRLDNYLVHSPGLDLWICDFGGSFCEKLGLDGRHLPDDPFFDPRLPYESSPATDIFSLGSIFYTILTGHWPHLNGSTPVGMAKFEFQEKANKLFKEGKFPNLSGISGGEVIDGCWNHKYATAAEVLAAVEKAIKSQGFEM